VTFTDGAATLGTGTLNASGQATLTTSGLVTGSHSIRASYGGDAAFSGSVSGILTQAVNKAATNTTLVSSANPAGPGKPVTFTATVRATAPGTGTPTGTVTFKDGAATLGTGTLDGAGQAALTTSSLTMGPHAITAQYGGDGNFLPNVSSVLTERIGQTPRDFDGDGRADILWRANSGPSTGMAFLWRMDGPNIIGTANLGTLVPAWEVKALADFDGDGKTDVLWRLRTTGETYIWLMDGGTVRVGSYTATAADSSWTIAGTGDLDGNGKADIVWRRPSDG
jgi:hypothetical protein